jgi:alanyl-tRNA synthetase
LAGLTVTVTETTPEQARKQGAIALFGEKYGETVRVVDMGGWSIELCGGTHLENTQTAGLFKITSESGVASGTRRIEALTGSRALSFFREAEARLQIAAAAAKTQPDKLTERITAMQGEIKQLKQELTRAKTGAADGAVSIDAIIKDASVCKGFTLALARVEQADIEALRALADKLRSRLSSGVLILCGVQEKSVQFLIQATDDAVKAGAHAGLAVKEAAALCGGGGGGRPNSAQAGGKDASKANEGLALALDIIKKQLEGGHAN